jgi:hypothetical protein
MLFDKGNCMNISSVQSQTSGYLSPETTGAKTATDPRPQLYAQPAANTSDPAATVNFSPESRTLQKQTDNRQESEATLPHDSETAKKSEKQKKSAAKAEKSDDEKSSIDDLTEEERRQVAELKKRDAEVKAHEQAHIAAGGAYVSGGASYEYQQGPDHQNYAVGGEVSIDTSAENTPEATIRKMQIVKRAALAPQKPSGQDRSVAAQAAQVEARARIELRQQRTEEAAEKKEKSAANSATGPLTNNQSATENRTEENSANPSNNRQTQNPQAGNQLNRAAQAAYQSAETSFTPFNYRQNSPSYNAFA